MSTQDIRQWAIERAIALGNSEAGEIIAIASELERYILGGAALLSVNDHASGIEQFSNVGPIVGAVPINESQHLPVSAGDQFSNFINKPLAGQSVTHKVSSSGATGGESAEEVATPPRDQSVAGGGESSPLIEEIEAFVRRTGIAESTFGLLAVNDGKLVRRLRGGGRMFRETEDRIRAFIASRTTEPTP